jgi:hypothetical protein
VARYCSYNLRFSSGTQVHRMVSGVCTQKGGVPSWEAIREAEGVGVFLRVRGFAPEPFSSNSTMNSSSATGSSVRCDNIAAAANHYSVYDPVQLGNCPSIARLAASERSRRLGQLPAHSDAIGCAFELTRAKAQDCEPKEEEKLHPEQSKFSKIPIQGESSLSKLSGTSESHRVFSVSCLRLEPRRSWTS